MRFMTIVKGREGCLPSQALIDRIRRLGEQATGEGVMVGMGGLGPTAQGARARLSKDGKITVTDGPFSEAKEVIGGYALLRAGSKAEVVALCKRFLGVVGQGTCEVHELFEVPAHG